MRNASIRFLFISTVICLVAITCSNQSQDEAMRVWQAYVDAVRAGDTAAVRAMYTPESRGYFYLYSDQAEQFKQARMTLVKTAERDAYVELQVLSELSGHQAARFYYLVRSDGRLALQYPFLIFAKSWPTFSSAHLVFHRQVQSLVDEDSLSSYQRLPDTAEFEALLTRLTSLTGIQPPNRIDYYFCQNQDEVSQLRGLKGLGGTLVGRCIVTSSNRAAWEVAQVALAGEQRPCKFLYYGVLGWMALQRPVPDATALSSRDRVVAEAVQGLKIVPLWNLVKRSRDSMRTTSEWMQYWTVGGTIVDELVRRKGDSTFRVLFQTSVTPEKFEEQLGGLYGLTLQDIQTILLTKYKWSLSALAQQKDSSVDSAAYPYEEIKYLPTDLERELVDVRFFRTEHCVIECDATFYPQILRLVAMGERAYEQVARDFNYDWAKCRPVIAVLSHSQFGESTENETGGYVKVMTPDSIVILIDGGRFAGESELLARVIRHELAHFVIYQLSGRPIPEIKHWKLYRQSGHDFEEALCQSEEPRENNLAEMLKKQFPTGRFMTVRETDTVRAANSYRSVTEYRVLVDLLIETYGKRILPKLGRTIRTASLPETLEHVTGRPWPEIEQQWMDRMRQLVLSS